MNRSKVFAGAAIAALLSLTPLAASANAILTNPQDGGTIGPIGTPGLPNVLGEVFTAPVTGVLSSFTLTFNGVPDNFTAGIGTWNGPASYAEGFGVSALDYSTGTQTGVASGDFTFNPNTGVVAGQQYVAFISTFGLFTDPLGGNGLVLSQTPTSGIDYIVYNLGDPNSSAWNYFTDTPGYNLAMTARFTTRSPCNPDHPLACVPVDTGGGVPEPASWALMISGFGMAGAMLRRQRAAAA